MKLYSKTGDRGMTSIETVPQVSKADDRIESIGAIDELQSSIGVAKACVRCERLFGKLERIQTVLAIAKSGLTGPKDASHTVPVEEIAFLESQIDKISELLESAGEVLPGQCELSARLDMARAVARRAERVLVSTDRKFIIQQNTKAYINRLSDYLYAAARFVDLACVNGTIQEISKEPFSNASSTQAASAGTVKSQEQRVDTVKATGNIPPIQIDGVNTNAVIEAVLKQIGENRPIDLKKATTLIEAIEKFADAQGMKAVIAVCNGEGNPIAVHVMDGAFLVSYEVAVKKAYTAVAVKMPTIELAKLVAPGQTFYGLQNLEKLVVFGGGVPLKIGDRIVGGLGISGGTGEQDHALCEFGLKVFEQL